MDRTSSADELDDANSDDMTAFEIWEMTGNAKGETLYTVKFEDGRKAQYTSERLRKILNECTEVVIDAAAAKSAGDEHTG